MQEHHKLPRLLWFIFGWMLHGTSYGGQPVCWAVGSYYAAPTNVVPLPCHRRNEMVLLNLVVNGVTLMFAVVSAVTGAFGMNLNAWMPQETKQSAVRHNTCSVPANSAPMQPCPDARLQTPGRRPKFPADACINWCALMR